METKIKRFFVDWLGNYVFFVPIVLGINGWGWSHAAIVTYLLSSIVIAGVSGRLFTLFLSKFWYRIWKVDF